MTHRKTLSSAALAAFLAGAVVTAAPRAFAWTRTVGYYGPILSFSNTRTRIGVPSDTGSATSPGGNAASLIYVDFSTVGGSSATNVISQACGIAYNGAGGGCGAATNGSYTAGNYYDVSVAKWLGTGSAYDYFYVDVINNNAGALQPLGVAIAGS